MADAEARLVGHESRGAPRALRARENGRRFIRVIACRGSGKSSAGAERSKLKKFWGHRTTEIPRLHRPGLLRRRPASCPGRTVAAVAAVSSFKKSLSSMTQLLRQC